MYTNFYTISNSLKFDDIVKMNSINFMFRARNNLLSKNLQLLDKAKSLNGNLFHRIKLRTDISKSILFIEYWSNAVEQITTKNKKHYEIE